MPWRYCFLLVIATRAWACSCGGSFPAVKQAWQKAPIVFLGTVETADPDDPSNKTQFLEQSVRIRVEEAFKGVVVGQGIDLRQGATSCDAKFQTGQRAVFYLYQGDRPGTWRVPWCTHSIGNAEAGSDDLLFLKGLPRSAVGTRLSGEVELYEDSPTEAFKRVGGISNVRVTITGSRGTTRVVTTNAAGAYEVYGLQPGSYSVRVDLPKGLKVKFPMIRGVGLLKDPDATVELDVNGASGVSFVVQAD